MNRYYHNKTNRLNKSYDVFTQAGDGNPWKLLASAILFQAAVDCQCWTPEIEARRLHGDLRLRRRHALVEFINSDWIDMLLSWQNEIRPEAYCEELVRRLTS
ncbi:MAG: hypothetical protein IKY65_04370 [Rikenellaceae bacterium]|nr:hypothetical protein [Rikenellaceae bacterium]